MVEAVIRHHTGACFSALQQAVLRSVQGAESSTGPSTQLLPVSFIDDGVLLSCRQPLDLVVFCSGIWAAI